MARSVLHRRRRGVHRQPLRRPPARRSRHVERSRLYDNFSSGREWHLRPSPATMPASGRPRRREGPRRAHATRWPVTTSSSTSPRTRTSPARRPSRTSTSARARSSPRTWSRPCARPAAKRILYASGSGVYGDLGELEADEDHGPLLPISTYGASKLAGEALICAVRHMFGLTRLRLPLRQRRRPAADPRRRLRLRAPAARRPHAADDPRRRHAEQVVHPRERRRRRGAAGASPSRRSPFEAFNVATGDYITVTRDRRAGDRVPRARPEARCARVHRAATAGGRATSRSCAWTRAHPGLGWTNGAHLAEALAELDRWRCFPTCEHGRERDVQLRSRPSSSIATGSSTGRWSAEGRPYPPRRTVGAGAASRACVEACRDAAAGGFKLVVVTNQPDIARGTQRRGGRGDERRCSREQLASTSSGSARTTTATAARAANPGPGMLARGGRGARTRPRGERHGRRPLAGRRERAARGLLDRVHRPGLCRAPPGRVRL